MLKVNALILGKSGSGKSSLLNYLWGAKIADVAAGRPVTPESDSSSQGIYPYPPVILDELQLVIHDSWGMEANKAEKWKDLIKKESQKCDSSNKISNWIHTIIYCVSAKGARIEDFELDSIISPLIADGNRILFVLTKADIASENEKVSLRNILTSQFPHQSGIIEVSSHSQLLRSGKRTEAFGREEMLEAILSNLRQNLIEKIPTQLLRRAREGTATLRREAIAYYNKEAGFTRTYPAVLSEVGALVQNDSSKLVININLWVEQALKDAAEIYHLVGMQFSPNNFSKNDNKTFSGAAFLTQSNISWKAEDYIANTLFHLVPGINILFMFAKKEMHRNMLIEKLDEGINSFENDIVKIAQQIHSKLGEVLALPAPT
ncbi:GTPase domain-containing protein [Aquitalea magnusonii]|uniref:50S ribosome-binding GTPase n=1 Tax=Aquitalea magnusonii TaxID=332411 RepID=A0A318ISZ8_9NEIS|nr:GTPase domain-containing protein [Aquitalea magnusonii]PXX38619.1 50S ribosome-binding GTPase [Aquitalea magnusonii]